MPWGGDSPAGAAEPNDHVIVGELPGDMTEDRLKEIFGQYGTIKWCKLSTGKGGKAGQTSAIIELDTVDEATYFVTALDENIPEGLTTPVRVRYKPPNNKGGKGGKGDGKGAGGFAPFGGAAGGKDRPSPYGGGGFGKGDKGDSGKGFGKVGGGSISDVLKALSRSGAMPGGQWQNDENTVFVSGLPADTTNADLLKIFSPFGAIAHNGCHCPLNPDGTAKGTGIINFLDSNGSQGAVGVLNNAVLPSGTYLKLRTWKPNAPGKGGKGE